MRGDHGAISVGEGVGRILAAVGGRVNRGRSRCAPAPRLPACLYPFCQERHHARKPVEREARAPVRSHQGRPLELGKDEDTAEEIAARTVNKERARARRVAVSQQDIHRRHLLGEARRVALARGRGPDRGQLTPKASKGRQRPLDDEQGAARARGRPVKKRKYARPRGPARLQASAWPVDRLAGWEESGARAARAARDARRCAPPGLAAAPPDIAAGLVAAHRSRPGQRSSRTRRHRRSYRAPATSAPALAASDAAGDGAAGAGEHHRLAAPTTSRSVASRPRPRSSSAARRSTASATPRWATCCKRLPGVTLQGRPGRGGADPPARPRQRLHADPARRRARAAGLLDRFDLTPDQIERIEILRAPTAETGARAIAGTINIITREGYTRRRQRPAPQRRLRERQARPVGLLDAQRSARARGRSTTRSRPTASERDNEQHDHHHRHDLADGTVTLAQREVSRARDARLAACNCQRAGCSGAARAASTS